MSNERIYKMSFSKVYPLYVKKVERKGQSKEDLDTIIRWLTGYDQGQLDAAIADNRDFETFFSQAPKLNDDRKLITGVICGIRVENIQEPLMQEIRYLDKIVDELANGKAMEKIMRSRPEGIQS